MQFRPLAWKPTPTLLSIQSPDPPRIRNLRFSVSPLQVLGRRHRSRSEFPTGSNQVILCIGSLTQRKSFHSCGYYLRCDKTASFAMLCSQILPFGALLATALAQVDLGKVAAESPACVVRINCLNLRLGIFADCCFQTDCTVTNLADAQCQLTDVQNCLCTNTTLLFNLSICVQGSCNLTEQASKYFNGFTTFCLRQ